MSKQPILNHNSQMIGAGDAQWKSRGWATVGTVHSLPVQQAAASLAAIDDHPNGNARV